MKYELDIHVLFLKTVFNYGFSVKMICTFFICKNKLRNLRNKHFLSQENEGIFHIIDQIKVSRVPF